MFTKFCSIIKLTNRLQSRENYFHVLNIFKIDSCKYSHIL